MASVKNADEDAAVCGQTTDTEPSHGVGPRLREVRQGRGMSLAQVAAMTGFSRSFLSKAERGLSSTSLSSLLKWTAALDIGIASLFEARPGLADKRCLTPSYEANGVKEYLLTPVQERRFEVFEQHLEPGCGPDLRFWSVDADFAFVYVVSGSLEIEFEDDERRVELETGDLHVYSPRTPHRWMNTSSGRTIALLCDSPASF
jgi:transcriptional regulator with XRE-family HTH domain